MPLSGVASARADRSDAGYRQGAWDWCTSAVVSRQQFAVDSEQFSVLSDDGLVRCLHFQVPGSRVLAVPATNKWYALTNYSSNIQVLCSHETKYSLYLQCHEAQYEQIYGSSNHSQAKEDEHERERNISRLRCQSLVFLR